MEQYKIIEDIIYIKLDMKNVGDIINKLSEKIKALEKEIEKLKEKKD